jgi:hypothetical protein
LMKKCIVIFLMKNFVRLLLSCYIFLLIDPPPPSGGQLNSIHQMPSKLQTFINKGKEYYSTTDLSHFTSILGYVLYSLLKTLLGQCNVEQHEKRYSFILIYVQVYGV